MNIPVIKQWIEALRSGEYEQGIGYLHANDTYCCLGVLCELHQKVYDEAWAKNGGINSYYGCQSYLPDSVREWAGLGYSQGFWTKTGYSLAQLNDRSYSFAIIADIIEEQLNKYIKQHNESK